MPHIIDNISLKLSECLKQSIPLSFRGDFCIGYFNLRGWKLLTEFVDQWKGGDGNNCRLLIGMQKPASEQIKEYFSIIEKEPLSNAKVVQLRKQFAEELKEQLTFGLPNGDDEKALQNLSRQIKEKKVTVRLFLAHPLHAKLYLLFRNDFINPKIGFVGSSNLTLAGLSHQGELNVDVLDKTATDELANWFEDRWNDRWCLDISEELASIIDNSWASETPLLPYHIYLFMAYHLSREALLGISEFKIPKEFKGKLLEFQEKAVLIAAHHIYKRGGALVGDVVGLGKTMVASAIAKIFDDDFSYDCLIICPKNLVPMWEDYKETYRLHGKVLSISKISSNLKDALRKYKLVIIDESHNLRNRKGKRYRAIREYIQWNESKVVLLSATPYNKTYLDLSNQLRLIIPDEKELPIRPEKLFQVMSETEFMRLHQASPRSIVAFEQSLFEDDWRELMRLYMVRRTRSFIKEKYAKDDPEKNRKYLLFADGSRFYFPDRLPKTIRFKVEDNNPHDQYAQLYSDTVVDLINHLNVPRYGLRLYVDDDKLNTLSSEHAQVVDNLSKAGVRLMGFSRTNLFKRLESSGHAFLLSISRHILRNHIFIYALKNNLDIPIGVQDSALLDTNFKDEDADRPFYAPEPGQAGQQQKQDEKEEVVFDEAVYKSKAEKIYDIYSSVLYKKFKWLPAELFKEQLLEQLQADAASLLKLLNDSGAWRVNDDEKLKSLISLLKKKHPDDKVLVFTQFADTAEYLFKQLSDNGIEKMAVATGNSENVTHIAWHFSPVSNHKMVSEADELKVLVATDVMSEGQNLQDAHIIVNFDLPWAIIRLIQRAGRVDRIGQRSEKILCYSFLPAEGVERIIRLRNRLRNRLRQNAEVVGSDEEFFADDDPVILRHLYTENSGILDDDKDDEVDLASYAYQIWKDAIDADPSLKKKIENLQKLVYSTKANLIEDKKAVPDGVLVYTKTGDDNDVLCWINKQGETVTQSQKRILDTAKCTPETPHETPLPNHHKLVETGVRNILKEEKSAGGQLGNPRGARFRAYERLIEYQKKNRDTLFDTPELKKTIEALHRYPLLESAKDKINNHLKMGITDESLIELINALRLDDRLSLITDEGEFREPQIICSLGLRTL